MKRTLLTLAGILLAVAGAHALTTDGQVYEPADGMKIANQWILDRVHTPADYSALAICNNRARTATMTGGVIYVGRSEEREALTTAGDTVMQSVLHRFSAADGSVLPDLPLTLDGEPYGRFLGVASVGCDHFGHVWVAPMTSNLQPSVPVYLVDTETGELSLVTELDKDAALQRTDYLDVMGDLTLEQAQCNIMAVAGSVETSGFPSVYRMHADQDGDWEGGFDGDPYMDFLNFYPDSKTGFSMAPVVKMVLGDDPDDPDSYYAGERFYIDCFDSSPVLYDLEGNILDCFEGVDVSLVPKAAPNGMMEFSVDDRHFFIYARADMNGVGNGCQANICEFDEDMLLSSMQMRWQVPADSLGQINDGGLRVHCFATETEIDDKGNEVVTLMTFKAFNGLAVYKIGVNVESADGGDPCDVNNDGVVDVADLNIIINIALGKDVLANYPKADISGDGEVDVTDINAVINAMKS